MTEKETLKGRIHMTSHKSASGNTYITADLHTGDKYPTRLIIFKKAIDDNPGISDLQDQNVEIEAYANQYSVQTITADSQPAYETPEVGVNGYRTDVNNSRLNQKPGTGDLGYHKEPEAQPEVDPDDLPF